jgi:hypothetical protein
MKTKCLWSFAALFATALLTPPAKQAFATTITVNGNYTIATSGLTGNAPTIIDDLAPATNFTLSVPTTGNLTTNFLEFDPNNSGSGIYTSANCYGFCDNSHNNIVSEAVTATFHFTNPAGDSTAAVVTGEFYANYSGPLDGTQGGTSPLNCGDSGNPADCIVWNSGDPITASFSNGDVLTLALNNAHDWDITSTLTASITQDAPPVPEPMSVALFGTALLGFGVIRRQRNRV